MYCLGHVMDDEVLETLKEKNIQVEFVPKSLTHILQACDRHVNKEFKRVWREVFDKKVTYMKTLEGKVKAQRELFVEVLDETVKQINAREPNINHTLHTRHLCGNSMVQTGMAPAMVLQEDGTRKPT